MSTAATLERPSVRRLPVPESAPPYDDERLDEHRRLTPAQGTLALEHVLPSGVPAVPAARLGPPGPGQQLVLLPDVDGLRPAAGRAARESARWEATLADERWALPQRSARDDLPDPRTWALRLVQGVLEVLSGDRPVQQLARWTGEELYTALAERAETAERSRRRRYAARRSARPPRRRLSTRPYVRSVHVSEPLDGVVESTALVQVGGRCRALALRLEGLDGRWRATVAELV